VRILVDFWAHVQKTEACWNWTGFLNWDGYGQISNHGKTRRAHRIAWELTRGSIPKGKLVLHTCDNPPCVNPDHLYLGTDLDNARDRDRRGRRIAPKGESNGRSKLTTEQIIEIRRRYAQGGTSTRKLARQFAISQNQIWRIIKRLRWFEVSAR
jgi:hypothetical protein